MRDGQELAELYSCRAFFYEADIQVDEVLGYGWMVEFQIGVFPHNHALVLDRPLTLLYGLGTPPI